MSFKWIHYTNTKDLVLDQNYKLSQPFINKPDGFWLSYNTEWIDWCESAEFYTFNPEHYYEYEFEINPKANIITISSIKDLNDFIEKYATIEFGSNKFINWGSIRSHFDGIKFLNFNEIKRGIKNMFYIPNPINAKESLQKFAQVTWFLGLDCSCSCIFNISILTLINKTEKINLEYKQIINE
ncbi:MAG: hypothetical protein ACRCZI_03945 [Cetobacterium sp.]